MQSDILCSDIPKNLQSSWAAEVTQEAFREGIEQGEKIGIIESIMTLLKGQFQPDAVQVLQPTLESIDDSQRLRELLLAAPKLKVLKDSCSFCLMAMPLN